jgi:hypothetical protein
MLRQRANYYSQSLTYSMLEYIDVGKPKTAHHVFIFHLEFITNY